MKRSERSATPCHNANMRNICFDISHIPSPCARVDRGTVTLMGYFFSFEFSLNGCIHASFSEAQLWVRNLIIALLWVLTTSALRRSEMWWGGSIYYVVVLLKICEIRTMFQDFAMNEKVGQHAVAAIIIAVLLREDPGFDSGPQLYL